mgnify:FL=1|jgi:hypothetical protein
MLGYYEIKTNSSSIWKIITAVGITVAGALCFLIPKVGWIIGGTIVGAGITGLMAAAKNSNITWGDFAKEVGIGAAIGAATGGIMKGGTAVFGEVLLDSAAGVVVRGAIEGATTGAAAELIRLGLDPNHHNFDPYAVLTGAGLGILMRFVQFKL